MYKFTTIFFSQCTKPLHILHSLKENELLTLPIRRKEITIEKKRITIICVFCVELLDDYTTVYTCYWWFSHKNPIHFLHIVFICFLKIVLVSCYQIVLMKKNFVYAFTHNWLLQPFSQDYSLACHITHIMCVNFSYEWRDLLFKVECVRHIYEKFLFMLKVLVRNMFS